MAFFPNTPPPNNFCTDTPKKTTALITIFYYTDLYSIFIILKQSQILCHILFHSLQRSLDTVLQHAFASLLSTPIVPGVPVLCSSEHNYNSIHFCCEFHFRCCCVPSTANMCKKTRPRKIQSTALARQSQHALAKSFGVPRKLHIGAAEFREMTKFYWMCFCICTMRHNEFSNNIGHVTSE